MTTTIVTQSVKIYNAICDSIDRRTQKEIDALFTDRCVREDGAIDIDAVIENVDTILEAAEWDKDVFVKVIFGLDDAEDL